MVAFARSIGLDAVEGDAECGILPPGPYDAVWCSNLLEHVTSPHNMLRAFYNNLKPGGLLFLKIPLIPHPVFGWIYSRLVGVPGYAAEEHLYAYSRSTAAFIVERAGFVVLEANCFWPSIRPISDAISPLLSRIGTTITVVGRRLDSFAYAEKRP
jgi:SAM-dependent methyltransferase